MSITPIADEKFEDLLTSFEREALHLETRDAYGTAVELPHMAKWAVGEPDDLGWLSDWCATLQAGVKAGRSVRRARIVSEPLSDYQRWSYSIAQPMVDAGEDIRWVPRRLVATTLIPRKRLLSVRRPPGCLPDLYRERPGRGQARLSRGHRHPALPRILRGRMEAGHTPS